LVFLAGGGNRSDVGKVGPHEKWIRLPISAISLQWVVVSGLGPLRIVSAGLLQRISANWDCSGQSDGFREELAASYENCKRSHNGKFYSFKQAFS